MNVRRVANPQVLRERSERSAGSATRFRGSQTLPGHFSDFDDSDSQMSVVEIPLNGQRALPTARERSRDGRGGTNNDCGRFLRGTEKRTQNDL